MHTPEQRAEILLNRLIAYFPYSQSGLESSAGEVHVG